MTVYQHVLLDFHEDKHDKVRRPKHEFQCSRGGETDKPNLRICLAKMESYCNRDGFLCSGITVAVLGIHAAQRRRQEGKAKETEKNSRQS